MDSDLLLSCRINRSDCSSMYLVGVIEQVTSHCLLIGYDAVRLHKRMNMFILCRSRIVVELQSNRNFNNVVVVVS